MTARELDCPHGTGPGESRPGCPVCDPHAGTAGATIARPAVASARRLALADREPLPVPLTDPRPLPPFPLDALPGRVRDMVAAVAEFTQTDPGMAGTSALAVLAATAGGRVEVEPRPGWREPVNLYTATVAGPGERKSAVQALMTAPLRDAERTLTDRTANARLEAATTREVRLRAAEQAKATAGKAEGRDDADTLLVEAVEAVHAAEAVVVPPAPRLLADDVTPEACGSLLAEQRGRLAVFSAEGGLFDTIGGRYTRGVPALDVWLKGHAGDLLRVDRTGRASEFVERPALTLGLMIQPQVLTDLARQQAFRGRGLLARFLYALPPSRVGGRVVDPPPIPPAVAAEYSALVHDLAVDLADRPESGVLTLDPEADRVALAYARRVEPDLAPGGALAHLADWGSKLVGATLRVAGLLHVAAHPHDGWHRPIGGRTVEQAVRLGDYYCDHARRAFDEMRADPTVADALYVLDVLRRRGRPEVTRRDLHAGTSRSKFPKVGDLDPVIALLEVHGYLTRRPAPPTSGPGRPPSPAYAVHPSVLATETAVTTEPADPEGFRVGSGFRDNA